MTHLIMFFYKYKKLMRNLGQSAVMPQSAQIKAKSELLANIRRSSEWQSAVFYAPPQPGAVWRWQSAGAMALLLFMVLGGGSWATIAKAKASLPGDVLYGVKITMEKAQINLAFSQQKQAELEMSFASTRLDEVNKLIAQDGDAKEVAANVSQAMERFSSSLGAVQKKLDSTKNEANKVVVAKAGQEESLVKLQGKIETIEKKISEITTTATDKSAIINEKAINEAKAVLGQNSTSSPESLDLIKEKAEQTKEKAQNIADAKKILETVEETKALVQATKEVINSILDK